MSISTGREGAMLDFGWSHENVSAKLTYNWICIMLSNKSYAKVVTT